VEFTAESRNVEVGQAVGFSPKVSGGFSPYSFAWDFGDGKNSKEEQPFHSYDKTGTYKVTLTVTDDRGNKDISGFTVDKDGNILITIPVMFRVYAISPDGQVSYFGKPGGAPGRFNIVAGIARRRRATCAFGRVRLPW
jgi:hypothetical protein